MNVHEREQKEDIKAKCIIHDMWRSLIACSVLLASSDGN